MANIEEAGGFGVSTKEGHNFVEAWSFGGLLLERYFYAPGPAEALSKQSHGEYQFCLNLDFPGEYWYRGGRHKVPIGALSAIHPGEVHAARDTEDRRSSTNFRTMYAGPALLLEAAGEVAGSETNEPFFAGPVIPDRELAQRFLRLHLAMEEPVPRLERDWRLLDVLTTMVERHGDTRGSSRSAGTERRAVRLAREYLEDNYTENVSLEELSRLTGLSPYYLSRVFSREVGLPPHRYQVQVRVGRARALLAGGIPPRKVAPKTGFADQSHLGRHFRRIVGVPPGRYSPRGWEDRESTSRTH